VKVVLFSYHYFESKLRAGFHHLAEAYWDLGWEVVFVTAPISPLSRLIRDRRLHDPVLAEANRPKAVRERLTSYPLYTRTHPANLRLSVLNRITGPFFLGTYRRSELGALEPELASADLIVFESTPAIVLVPLVRALAPDARLVYRVSDDLEILRVHPAVFEAELEALPLFDYVSSPSRYSAQKLGAVREVDYEQHAIAKHLFDAWTPSPYGGGVNAVWVGKALLDPVFLEAASRRLSDWRFHLVGPASPSVSRPNVVWHGELAYERTIPFLQHADVGLAAYGGHEGRVPGYLADSMKIVQYAYCGLPVVAPYTLRSERPHVFYYEFGDADSIEGALRASLAAGKRHDLARSIPSWHDLASTLAGRGDGSGRG
jgi:2-beta-glucuronyltransferase